MSRFLPPAGDFHSYGIWTALENIETGCRYFRPVLLSKTESVKRLNTVSVEAFSNNDLV